MVIFTMMSMTFQENAKIEFQHNVTTQKRLDWGAKRRNSATKFRIRRPAAP